MNRLAILGAAALLGGCATMDRTEAQDIVLLRAKMESFGEPRELASQDGDVAVGARFSVRLAVRERLIGQLEVAAPEVDLTIASIPKADELKDIYLLVRKLPDGKLQALQWNYAVSGLCIQRDAARQLRIEDDLEKLRQTGGVKWNADCSW